MAGRHRTKNHQRISAAMISAATATATVLTVGVAPPPERGKPMSSEYVDLAAAIQLLPNSGQYPNPKTYPDLTGGLGTTVYDASQAFRDQLARAIVSGLSLTALAQAAGVNPQSLVDKLLSDLPPTLVSGIVDTIGNKINLPLLGQLTGDQQNLLSGVVNLLHLGNLTDGTLSGILALLGLNLQDPFNLSNLITEKLGVNLITAGPTFTVLKMLGVDLGWVPGTPNSVADAINGSPYLKVGLNGLLNTSIDTLKDALASGNLGALNLDPTALDAVLGLPLLGPIVGPILGPILGGLGSLDLAGKVNVLVQALGGVLNSATGGIPDIIDTRVTPTVGIGIGAFAAAMAYQQVIADLPNQPGGTAYTGVNPFLGSLSILPLILVNNPGRPDGGIAARFDPLAALLGIDTVNPKTEITGDGENAALTALLGHPLGLHLGGANVLPVLVDATYEYQPLSDFASWPNPITLANNIAAALMPTYMLRGLDLTDLPSQLTSQVNTALGNTLGGNPLALNLYLTLHSATLPLLEPLYLTSDALNLVGLSPLAQIPMRLANALAPALKILTDLGYSNVTRKADGTYVRNFDNAGDEVPFMSFPKIDPIQALGDVFNALVGGFQKEFGPNPTPSTPNAIKTLVDTLTGAGLAVSTAQSSPQANLVSSVPQANSKMLSITDAGGAKQAADYGAEGEQKKADDPAAGTQDDASVTTGAQDDAAARLAARKAAAAERAAARKAAREAAAEKATAATDTATPSAGGEDGAAQDVKKDDTAASEGKSDDKTKSDDKAKSDSTVNTKGRNGPRHAKPTAAKDDAGKDGADSAGATVKKPKHAKPDAGSDAGAHEPRHAKKDDGGQSKAA